LAKFSVSNLFWGKFGKGGKMGQGNGKDSGPCPEGKPTAKKKRWGKGGTMLKK